MKLQTKITLFSSVFVLLLIVAVNTIIYIMFFKISTENELEQLTTQTNAIVETLTENPDIPRKNLLQAFLPSKGMIRLVDDTGDEVISTLTKDEIYTKIPPKFSNRETSEVVKDKQGNYVALVQKPIIYDGNEIVTLQVANYLVTLEETMKTLLYVLIATSLFMLVPTVVASNALSRFILQPIKAIVKAMKENISEKKWQQIEIKNRSKDELYEMEDTFNKMMIHLKDSFQKQEDFVSNASHELKTPISIMKGYAQLLQRRGKTHPEVFDEAIHAIDSEADRMEKLVHQLLMLAKRKESIMKESVDIAELAEHNMETFRKAYKREIIFHSQEKSLCVYGNSDQLEQVIYILLDNAIKYSDSMIKIVLLNQQQKLVMQVTDNGSGISEEDQAHIFDRFYRVDKARTRKTGGTGLGLAIANEIIDMHGGTLSVNSVLGEGTTFTLELPLISENNSTAETKE